jgi:hypothetical protein
MRYHTHIIKELVKSRAEKKFHEGNKDVNSMYDMPGRKVDFPSNL